MSEQRYAFLCGADMNPVAIRNDPALAGARFMGIGHVAAEAVPDFPVAAERIWGIVLAGGPAAGEQAITLQDGREVRGAVLTPASALADRAGIVSEARYWELPAAWWRILMES